MERASRFHVLEHAPQRGWCRKGRAGPERHFSERLHPKSRRGWPATSPRSTLRRMCCLGAPIALMWRFHELPEDLASYGPLPGLLSAAASLLFSCSVVAFSVLLRSLHCCLSVAIILPCAPSCGPCPLYFIYSSVLANMTIATGR